MSGQVFLAAFLMLAVYRLHYAFIIGVNLLHLSHVAEYSRRI